MRCSHPSLAHLPSTAHPLLTRLAFFHGSITRFDVWMLDVSASAAFASAPGVIATVQVMHTERMMHNAIAHQPAVDVQAAQAAHHASTQGMLSNRNSRNSGLIVNPLVISYSPSVLQSVHLGRRHLPN